MIREMSMTSLQWGRQFEVHAEQLDTDHRIISDLIVQLDDAVDTGQGHDIVSNIFSVLLEFIRHHSQREEAALARGAIVSRPDHLRDHNALYEGLLRVSQQWASGERNIHDYVHSIRVSFEAQQNSDGADPRPVGAANSASLRLHDAKR